MAVQDSVIIVTGASRGIGRETARALAAAGARVVAVARSAEQLADLAAETAGLPGEVLPTPADITQRRAAEAVVQQALAHYGRIDGLVNNAGVERTGPIEAVTDDDYAATLDTNLKAAFYFIRAVVPAMRAQGGGWIVNVASTAGLRGFADDAIYCASKFGLVGLSEALDEELRRARIRVCVVAPGAVNTDLARDTWSPPDDPYRPHYLQPADVGRAIVFVASQPAHVVIEQVVLRPLVEPPYSAVLPVPGQGAAA